MTKRSLASATGFRIAGLLALLAAAPAWAEPALSLPNLLDHTGQHVARFWSYFSTVTCTEALTQSKLGDKNKVLFEQRELFDYLITLQASGMDLSVDESRVEKAHKTSKGKAPLLETNGFAILTLIFHPFYQSRYEFRRLTDETLDGKRLLRVSFQQIVQERPLSVLLLRQHEYPLEWTGTAWIDPATWAVVRIQAGVGKSLSDTGLLRLDADVTYSAVAFNGSKGLWLPERAVIEAETRRQHWRNTHLFSNYRRFDVETQIRTTAPQ